MGKLEGKTALVTGGAQGIGGAIAKRFVEEGAQVALSDIQTEKGQAYSEQLGDNAIFLKHDVTSAKDWENVAQQVMEKFGKIDILINGAGILEFGTLIETALDTCLQIIQVNLVGPFLGIRTIAPLMCAAGSGAIINISSAEGMSAANGLNVYVASKWGVRGLSRVAALELGHQGVRVNTLCPGGINTPLANPSGVSSQAMRPAFARFPLQRIGEPEEVAQAALFFACDDSAYCCGAELTVDGGLSAGRYYSYLPGAPKK